MCQKFGRKSGLWVLHEIVNKIYAKNMKKIVGAVWELLAKYRLIGNEREFINGRVGPFLVIFLPTVSISFTKLRFRRSF